MQKWEYLSVKVMRMENGLVYAFAANNRAIRDVPPGTTIRIEDSPYFDDYAQQLGEQGWELVTSSGWYATEYQTVGKLEETGMSTRIDSGITSSNAGTEVDLVTKIQTTNNIYTFKRPK